MADLSKVKISFISDTKNILLEKKLRTIPLKEEIVINKSIEFFSDPSPCMIHRSAVMLRLYMEMLEYMEEHMGKDTRTMLWDDIPQHLRNYLDIETMNIEKVILSTS